MYKNILVKIISLLGSTSWGNAYATKIKDCVIILEQKWQNLEYNNENTKKFGSKWILAGSMTFKKHAKNPVQLSMITLQWKGPVIHTMHGSLYRKDPDKNFLPIEHNLVSDGIWNTAAQKLTFSFHTGQTISILTIFYLVLTIPAHTENTIREGYFIVHPIGLPIIPKNSLYEPPLILSLQKNESSPHKYHMQLIAN